MLTLSIKMEHVWKKNCWCPSVIRKTNHLNNLEIFKVILLTLKVVANLILLLRCGPTESFKTKQKAQTHLAWPKTMVPLK